MPWSVRLTTLLSFLAGARAPPTEITGGKVLARIRWQLGRGHQEDHAVIVIQLSIHDFFVSYTSRVALLSQVQLHGY